MFQQLAMASFFSKLLKLPASVTAGPEAALKAGVKLLARPGMETFWRFAEVTAPQGTLGDVLNIVMKDFEHGNDGIDKIVARIAPVKTFVLDKLPPKVRDIADFGITEYQRDPKALSAYIEENLDMKMVSRAVTNVISDPVAYRCPDCELPFFSNLNPSDIICPHCNES